MTDWLTPDIKRLLIALLIGALIGAEREYRSKSAGFRTMILVSLGSCLFTILSAHIGGPNNPDRIAANIITGIGFLGAGVIIHEQRSQKVHGLTTAASLWACALIGAAFGAGQFALGGLALTAIFLILAIGGPLERLFARINGIKRGSEISGDPD